jgi:hypothetical protein
MAHQAIYGPGERHSHFHSCPCWHEAVFAIGHAAEEVAQRGDSGDERDTHREVGSSGALAAAEARADAAERRERVLRALLVDARAEVDKWGYGDFHYGDTPRDPGVLAMLARIDAALGSVLTDPEPGGGPTPSKMWPGQVTDGSHLTWCGDRDCGDPSHAEPVGEPTCNPEHAHDRPCGAADCWWTQLGLAEPGGQAT